MFDKIPHRPLSTLNSLLSSHLRHNNPSAAWDLFHQIHRHRTDLDPYTLTPAIAACAALSSKPRGKQLHAMLVKHCSQHETIPNTALLDMYFKCNSPTSSFQLFNEMRAKDVVTWNTMISGLVRYGEPKRAIIMLREMLKEEVVVSVFVLCSVIKACSMLKALRLGKQAHGLVVVMGSDHDQLVLGTAVIDLYCSCGLMDEASSVLSGLSCRKDDAIYNGFISGCVSNGKYREALAILGSVKPNLISLTSVLGICSMHFDLRMGKQVHCLAVRFGFDSDTQLSNAILDMYAKRGEIVLARLVFDGIRNKTVVTWTSIINAYGNQGCGFEAFELFKIMKNSGVLPNSVTFLAVLSACAHSGLVEEGRESFVSMWKEYGIVPGPNHYGCFIDLLGRAGLMEEVWDVFSGMEKRGIKENVDVLASLLNACRVNLDIEKGEYVATRLIELEPDKPENWVALSNFYAAIERWDRVEELRNMMIEKRLRKEPARFWINE